MIRAQYWQIRIVILLYLNRVNFLNIHICGNKIENICHWIMILDTAAPAALGQVSAWWRLGLDTGNKTSPL